MSQDITNPVPMDPMLAFLDRAMRDPAFSVEKAEAAMRLLVEQQKRIALREFNLDFNEMQREMEQIQKDKPNPAFHSKYATLEAIDRAARPLYSRYGFAVRFGTAPASRDGYIQVTCTLSHRGGHSEESALEGPVSLEGGRGGRIGATPIQAVGSAITYLRRYLIQMALGLVAGNDPEDDDGEYARRRFPEAPPPPPPPPQGNGRPSISQWLEEQEQTAAGFTDNEQAQEWLAREDVGKAYTALTGEAGRRFKTLHKRVVDTWVRQPTEENPGEEAV